MQIGILTLKISENNNKIDNLIQKDSEINKNLQNNVVLIISLRILLKQIKIILVKI